MKKTIATVLNKDKKANCPAKLNMLAALQVVHERTVQDIESGEETC